MAIFRASDTLIQNLPKVLLETFKEGKTNNLDVTSIKDNTTFRDIINKTFPVMAIINYDDIESELSKYNTTKLPKDKKELLIKAIKKGIEKSVNLLQKSSSIELQKRLETITDSSASTGTKVVMIRQLFSKGYYLTDSESISSNSVVIVSQNFYAIKTQINERVNTVLQDFYKTDFNFGDYLDLGHSAVNTGQEEYSFNSPKMMAMLFDINLTNSSSFISNTVNLNTAAVIFAKKTEQLEQSVTVTKDFGNGFLRIFVQFGGSVVLVENKVENQTRGYTLEKKEKFGKNSAVLTKLVSQFKNIQDTAVKGLYNNSDLARIIRTMFKYTGSPSGLDFIGQSILDSLTGKPTKVYKGTDTAKKVTKIVTRESKVVGLVKKVNKATVSTTTPSATDKSSISLPKLLALLNSRLPEQISNNMGSGTDRKVLNYQSGRFAASAYVGRITQSKAGMITAFYTYMKNPYQTFEPGFRQGSPASRNPRLLISKSIREIAQSVVGNRMRAVLV